MAGGVHKQIVLSHGCDNRVYMDVFTTYLRLNPPDVIHKICMELHNEHYHDTKPY